MIISSAMHTEDTRLPSSKSYLPSSRCSIRRSCYQLHGSNSALHDDTHDKMAAQYTKKTLLVHLFSQKRRCTLTIRFTLRLTKTTYSNLSPTLSFCELFSTTGDFSSYSSSLVLESLSRRRSNSASYVLEKY